MSKLELAASVERQYDLLSFALAPPCTYIISARFSTLYRLMASWSCGVIG
jgi:hypothetical protein